ncbi:MAG: hypothetical protein B7Z75_02020 [Acidocella sp. 20-57-95]|nr:MAG: hypothetical protein B7Z75_02020 [Acidocella sp. 20-57-95]OYV62512.1 MAG: hypothetical protein B7Z71_00855 [Acidocella sp. 21-58-7]HQT63779.1 NUDIX domain-containing protein [Acidocella sp.]HQU03183.1 NUDIX domain-containing protein [Acidocella sp.]
MGGFVQDHMVVDPALQHQVIARVIAARIADQPAQAVQFLGLVELPDGQVVQLFARHAADAVLIDEAGQVVLVTRRFSPGAGLLAVPGGFIDEIDGVVEIAAAAAAREAMEETGIDPALLRRVGCTPIGRRAFNRPFDIRCAWNDPPGTVIQKGDLFSVSAQAFCFRIPGNLNHIHLQAGDDAKAVSIHAINHLTPELFAVPDHLTMIHAAMQGLR